MKIKTLFFVVLFSGLLKAQTIELDTSFGDSGILYIPLVGEADDFKMLVGQDNKIIAYGEDSPASVSVNPNKVYKLNNNGTLDNTFANNGILTLPNYNGELNVSLQGTDKLLITIYNVIENNIKYQFVRRYNLDGTLDTTFGTNGEIKVSQEGSLGFRSRNISVLSDNSFILSDGTKYTKYTNDGILNTNYGNNGMIITPTSGDIMLFSDNLLNFYNSKIEMRTINGSLVNTFGTGGIFTYPTQSDYFSKLFSQNIYTLDFNNSKLYNITGSGNLNSTINLTNDNNTLDPYYDFTFDGEKFFLVGGTSNSTNPFIVCYDINGNLIGLKNLTSYKEAKIPSGSFSYILNKDNALYVAGDMVDSNHKWYYIIAKYTFNNLAVSEQKNTPTFIFSNPVDNYLDYKSNVGVKKIDIYSMDGKFLKSINTNHSELKDLSKGIYILKVDFINNKSLIQKLIKK